MSRISPESAPATANPTPVSPLARAGPLPRVQGGFGVVYADPPWNFRTRSPKGTGRSPEGRGHYRTMGLDAIRSLPVGEVAADDSVCILWTTNEQLANAQAVLAAWGFAYKTLAFVWAKTTVAGALPGPIGLGFWTRSGAEVALLGTRGRPRRLSRGVRQVILGPRREHSRKPDEAYDRIEALVGGPYLELFARERRPGWHAWGDQLPAEGPA
jgi:N6-adenosine-specific RNA methylase IME4